MRASEIAVALRLLAAVASAGPFGLEQGMTLEELRAAKLQLTSVQEYWYKTATVPKMHSNFESYLLLVHPETGLASVRGIGRDIETDKYGVTIRGKYEELKAALQKKYGPFTDEFDYLMAANIWDELSDFTMGIAVGDRDLSAYWTKKLPEDLSAISLAVECKSSTACYINLGYDFSNCDRAFELMKAAEEDAF